ncbi:hypothetical protein [Endozoicomonas sp. GU-1]|uniref:hypothetical protein n=1 Tax=Endozoicomonas sp. GU-1 TaxID=3009078 RepID=UPI0022B39C5F|nr:hypothetical protein [Endozoicomonas sp. GU-1]WBA82430.1 hypothetical protein O2T12_04580 [Endozoicomonas sp. GU-1]
MANSGPFTGEYNGQCRTIRGLSDCFVDTQQGNISNLRFTGANIISQKTTGLAACLVDDSGTVRDTWAKDVHILTRGPGNHAGIGGGLVEGMVANIMAVDSDVTTWGNYSYAGIGGLVKGKVANIMAVDSNVTTSGNYAYAGIGGGRLSERLPTPRR